MRWMVYSESRNNGEQVPKRLRSFLALLLLGYYLPVLLVYCGAIPFRFRFAVLISMTVLMSLHASYAKRSWLSLGFSRENLKGSLFWNSIVSLLLIATILVAFYSGMIRKPTIPSWNLFFVFYIFISAPAQEFLYRSALFAEMSASGIVSPIAQIAISALTYSFLHIIYKDIITILVTLLMGVIWGAIYHYRRNFFGVAVSHSVLGALSILVGLV